MKNLKIELSIYDEDNYKGEIAESSVRELGITWKATIHQISVLEIWLLDCENVPEELPDWLTPIPTLIDTYMWLTSNPSDD